MKIKSKLSFIINGLFFASYFYLIYLTLHYKSKKSYLTKNNRWIIEYKGRNFDFRHYEQKNVDRTEPIGVFLTYGQSNSSNSGEIGYTVKNNVYQFSQGETFVYKDPSLGGTGNKGSVWGILGDKLINNGYFGSVVFSNCGYGGKKINELSEGVHFNFLVQNYRELVNHFGKVDAILFHQGESNNLKNDTQNYYEEFVAFRNKLIKKDISITIFLSRASLCMDKVSNVSIIKAQNKLIKDFQNIKAGPNTDLLYEKKYRLEDNCHFSLLGLDKFSDMFIKHIEREI